MMMFAVRIVGGIVLALVTAMSVSPAWAARVPDAGVRDTEEAILTSFPVGRAIALDPRATAMERAAAEGFIAGIVSPESVRSLRAVKVINCTRSGTVAADVHWTLVRVQSRMTDTSGRVGAISSASGRGYARIGGDLACTAKVHGYTAVGKATLTYPPGYVPGVTTMGAKSATKKLARDSDTGRCVWK